MVVRTTATPIPSRVQPPLDEGALRRPTERGFRCEGDESHVVADAQRRSCQIFRRICLDRSNAAIASRRNTHAMAYGHQQESARCRGFPPAARSAEPLPCSPKSLKMALMMPIWLRACGFPLCSPSIGSCFRWSTPRLRCGSRRPLRMPPIGGGCHRAVTLIGQEQLRRPCSEDAGCFLTSTRRGSQRAATHQRGFPLYDGDTDRRRDSRLHGSPLKIVTRMDGRRPPPRIVREPGLTWAYHKGRPFDPSA